jgi:N-acetylmuramoyl-L-alanine amidase
MSATPQSAELTVPRQASSIRRQTPLSGARSATFAPGHEALQALLAFSSLHEQIRQRRAHESQSDHNAGTDVWELENFVLDEVLQLVAERALSITGADGVAIALAESDAIVCRGSAGTMAPDQGARLDPYSGFSGACLRDGHIVRCDDSETDPRVDVHACRRLSARSMVAVPIAGSHGIIGLIEAFSTEAYGFNDSDVRNLSLLAELILAALKPQEEDRLAQISRRVVAGRVAESSAQLLLQKKPSGARIGATPQEKTADRARPVSEIDKVEKSRPGVATVLLMVVIAAALGTGLWWKMRHSSHALPALPQSEAPVSDSRSQNPIEQEEPAAVPSPGMSRDAIQQQLSVLPRITGIHPMSTPESSKVIIDLQDQVQYEAHRLSDPERIYFDLHDTALVPGLFAKTIEVGDARLVRVRIAQPMPGISRVVLETKNASNFSVSMETDPYRLVVEIRSNGPVDSSPTDRPKTDLQDSVRPEVKPGFEAKTGGEQRSLSGTLIPRFRIVLDAGHGGWDLGTVGQKGLLEKDLVLDIVARLGKLLERKLRADVVYTRRNDAYVALEKRAEIANLAHGDLFLSIHANYSTDSAARGVETYYTRTYSSVKARTPELDAASTGLQPINWTNVDIRKKALQSRQFASSIQQALFGAIAAQTPGIRNRGVKEASYVVLTGTTMPAILAEVSFVSSPADEDMLQNAAYRQQIAEALYKGVARYSKAARQVRMASTSGKPSGK